MRKKINKKFIVTLVGFLIGVALVLYPTVSDFINSLKYQSLVKHYNNDVEEINVDEYENILEEAQNYNEQLFKRKTTIVTIDENEKTNYSELLNINDTSIMGYIEIPKIKLAVPIYHGTSAEALQIGVGHMEESSLPIGGINTHSAISGHSGLPSAKLFTDIGKLEIGDTFYIKVLKEVLTYEVDNIATVEPDELDLLEIEEGKDYVTLITCTPYGINTHRLLVRGHRVETIYNENNKSVIDEIEDSKFYVLIIIGIIMVLLIILITIKLLKNRSSKCK